MDLASLGKTPISPEHPAGADVRYDPDFDHLQAEIDKLASPSATAATDWKKVAHLASSILSTKAKDLLVASYLAVALIHTDRSDGLLTGLSIMHDLLANFWEGLFPPRKRLRGRLAALEWWIEKSEPALKAYPRASLSAETCSQARERLQAIDALLEGLAAGTPSTLPGPFYRPDAPDLPLGADDFRDHP